MKIIRTAIVASLIPSANGLDNLLGGLLGGDGGGMQDIAKGVGGLLGFGDLLGGNEADNGADITIETAALESNTPLISHIMSGGLFEGWPAGAAFLMLAIAGVAGYFTTSSFRNFALIILAYVAAVVPLSVAWLPRKNMFVKLLVNLYLVYLVLIWCADMTTRIGSVWFGVEWTKHSMKTNQKSEGITSCERNSPFEELARLRHGGEFGSNTDDNTNPIAKYYKKLDLGFYNPCVMFGIGCSGNQEWFITAFAKWFWKNEVPGNWANVYMLWVFPAVMMVGWHMVTVTYKQFDPTFVPPSWIPAAGYLFYRLWAIHHVSHKHLIRVDNILNSQNGGGALDKLYKQALDGYYIDAAGETRKRLAFTEGNTNCKENDNGKCDATELYYRHNVVGDVIIPGTGDWIEWIQYGIQKATGWQWNGFYLPQVLSFALYAYFLRLHFCPYINKLPFLNIVCPAVDTVSCFKKADMQSLVDVKAQLANGEKQLQSFETNLAKAKVMHDRAQENGNNHPYRQALAAMQAINHEREKLKSMLEAKVVEKNKLEAAKEDVSLKRVLLVMGPALVMMASALSFLVNFVAGTLNFGRRFAWKTVGGITDLTGYWKIQDSQEKRALNERVEIVPIVCNDYGFDCKILLNVEAYKTTISKEQLGRNAVSDLDKNSPMMITQSRQSPGGFYNSQHVDLKFYTRGECVGRNCVKDQLTVADAAQRLQQLGGYSEFNKVSAGSGGIEGIDTMYKDRSKTAGQQIDKWNTKFGSEAKGPSKYERCCVGTWKDGSPYTCDSRGSDEWKVSSECPKGGYRMDKPNYFYQNRYIGIPAGEWKNMATSMDLSQVEDGDKPTTVYRIDEHGRWTPVKNAKGSDDEALYTHVETLWSKSQVRWTAPGRVNVPLPRSQNAETCHLWFTAQTANLRGIVTSPHISKSVAIRLQDYAQLLTIFTTEKRQSSPFFKRMQDHADIEVCNQDMISTYKDVWMAASEMYGELLKVFSRNDRETFSPCRPGLAKRDCVVLDYKRLDPAGNAWHKSKSIIRRNLQSSEPVNMAYVWRSQKLNPRKVFAIVKPHGEDMVAKSNAAGWTHFVSVGAFMLFGWQFIMSIYRLTMPNSGLAEKAFSFGVCFIKGCDDDSATIAQSGKGEGSDAKPVVTSDDVKPEA